MPAILTPAELREWLERHDPAAVVGYSVDANDCPCSRCITELRYADHPYKDILDIQVFELRTAVWHLGSTGIGMYLLRGEDNSPWLANLVRAIDFGLGAVALSRDALPMVAPPSRPLTAGEVLELLAVVAP